MNVPNFRKIDLVTYKPGRSLLSSKKKVIKLSANESAFGAGERVKNILKNRKSNISKYPDSKFKKLIETISKKFNFIRWSISKFYFGFYNICLCIYVCGKRFYNALNC